MMTFDDHLRKLRGMSLSVEEYTQVIRAMAEMEKAKAMYQLAQSIEAAAKTLLWHHSDS